MIDSTVIMQWRLILQDLFSASVHTQDFSANRGRILYKRVQLIAGVMALLSLLWVPVDYFALPSHQFLQVLWVRITWIVGFLLFAFGWGGHGRSLFKGYLRLFLMVLLFAASYAYLWGYVFDASVQDDFTAGYSFLPYVAITMLAVFPLTILEAGLCVLMVTCFVLLADLHSTTILALPIWIKLWFIGVISSIILWASVSQLHGLMVLYREATRDMVTGLVNRRLVVNEVDRIANRVLSEGKRGAVLLADLDRFKKINDEYGHLNGDLVLRDFAEVVTHLDPSLTVAGRFGGEEFLIVMEQLGKAEAVEVAERLNQATRERLVVGMDGEVLRYTVSIGIAEFLEGESRESLLERADSALYEAKGNGRDCAILASSPETTVMSQA